MTIPFFSKFVEFYNAKDLRTRKFNRNIIYSLVLKGGGVLISLLLIPITLNALNKYEYGVWITLYSILTWIYYFDIGLGNGLRNKLTESISVGNHILGRRYIGSTILLLSILSLFFVIIFCSVNSFIDWDNLLNIKERIGNLNRLTNIVFFALCISFVTRIVEVVFTSLQEIWINSLLTFVSSVLSLIWIQLLIHFESVSLISIAIAYTFSPIIVNIFSGAYLFIYRNKELKPILSLKYMRMDYRILGLLGGKFFLLQITGLIVFSTSNFLISKLFSPAEVTSYNIGFKYYNIIVTVFYMIISPLWSAITDALGKQDYQWIKLSMNKMWKYLFIFSIFVIILFICSHSIIDLWTKQVNLVSYKLSISLAIYTIILMWAYVVSSFSNGTNRLKIQLITSVISAILFPILAIFLSRIGVEGVVYAMAIASFIPAIFLTIDYVKIINLLVQKND